MSVRFPCTRTGASGSLGGGHLHAVPRAEQREERHAFPEVLRRHRVEIEPARE